MGKTWLIFRHEVLTAMRRPAYVFGTFGVYLFMAIIYAVINLVSQYQSQTEFLSQALLAATKDAPGTQIMGIVDHSGIIRKIPAEFFVDSNLAFQSFPDEQSAKQALRAGQLAGFYILPADFQSTGRVSFTSTDFDPFSISTYSKNLHRLIQLNLAGKDQEILDNLADPNFTVQFIEGTPDVNPYDLSNLVIPLFISMILQGQIFGTAGMLLSSLREEYSSRVLEFLMVSARPSEILVGKIASLGVLGLFQTAVWGSAWFFFQRFFTVGTPSSSGFSLDLPSILESLNAPSVITSLVSTLSTQPVITPKWIAWGIILIILGYLLYACIMAGVGALTPHMENITLLSFLIGLPSTMAPWLLLLGLRSDPNGIFVTFLSLFPFTSPVVIISRMAVGAVPFQQVWLAILLLAISITLILSMVARLFKTQILLTGEGINLFRFMSVFLGSEKPARKVPDLLAGKVINDS